MGRKAIINAIKEPIGHSHVWDTIRHWAGSFTYRDIYEAVNKGASTDEIYVKSVEDYIIGLKRAGYLRDVSNGKTKRFHVTDKVRGEIAPSVKRDGTVISTLLNGLNRMWRTMRVLQSFDYVELAGHAEVSPATAKVYIARLQKAGYVKMVVAARRGQKTGRARYQLVMDNYSGPKAPKILKVKILHDPNNGKQFALNGETREMAHE